MNDEHQPDMVASHHEDAARTAAIESIRRRAQIDPGTPGDCDLCGEWTGRLIEGACARCRDTYKLK